MIELITVKNLDNDISILIQRDKGCPYLLEDDGLIWNAVEAQHNTYTNLTGIGDVLVSTRLQPRPISITGRVCSIYSNKEIAQKYGISSIGAIQEKKLLEIEQYKQELSRVVNPLNNLRIYAGEFYLDGVPTSSITFSPNWKENNEVYCKFTFSLDCNDPTFRLNREHIEVLRGVTPMWTFPWVIKQNNNIFSSINSDGSNPDMPIHVYNSGDLETDGVIVVKTLDATTTRVLIGKSLSEKLLIVKSLAAEETIVIDLNKRTIMGSTDGVNYSNYMGYLDVDSKWFKLLPGVNNILAYTYKLVSSAVTPTRSEITLAINDRYYAIGGM